MALATYLRSGVNAEFGQPPVPISSLGQVDGSAGSGFPLVVVFFVTNDSEVLPHFLSYILFLGSSNTADSNGNIGISATLTSALPTPDGIHYLLAGGPITFPDGFWASSITATLVSDNNPPVTFTMQIGTSDTVLPTDDPPTGPPAGIFPPSGLGASWVPSGGSFYAALTWTDNSDNETGFGIERSDDGGVTWNQVAVAIANATSFNDNGVHSGNHSWRVYSFNDTVRSINSNEATLGFTITRVNPNSGLIGTNPTVSIIGTNLGDASTSQITVVHFRSRFNPAFQSDSSIITPVSSTEISVRVPDAPFGSEFVDVIIDDGAGSIATLIAGYDYLTSSVFALDQTVIPIRTGDPLALSLSSNVSGAIPAGAGSIVLSSLPNNSNFLGVQEVKIVTLGADSIGEVIVPDYYIINQTADFLFFFLPIGFGSFSGTASVVLVGDGVQFSGSVTVGTIQILFEDATGIYKLSDSKITDTLYARDLFIIGFILIMLPDGDELYSDELFEMLDYPTKILAQSDEIEEFNDYSIISSHIPISTIEVSIPSPFIRTAFLP